MLECTTTVASTSGTWHSRLIQPSEQMVVHTPECDPEETDTLPAVLQLPSWRSCMRVITSAPDQLTPADQFLPEQIQRELLLGILYQLTQRFIAIICQRQATLLDAWVDDCEAIYGAGVQHLAASLRQEYAAVRAALEFPWGNGRRRDIFTGSKCLSRICMGVRNWSCCTCESCIALEHTL